MTTNNIAAVILAAGKGTRMKSSRHKVLHKIAGREMLLHLLDSVHPLGPQKTLLVVGALSEQIKEAAPGHIYIDQTEQHGTGHAVMVCKDALTDFTGDVMVLFGDTPFIPTAIMETMLSERTSSADPGIVVLGFRPQNPGKYGRLVTNKAGTLDRIVEYKDASEEERAITLCNSGVMIIDGTRLFDWLDTLTNNNASGEYYLTDLVAAARKEGRSVHVVEAAEEDVLGVNSRADLAAAEAIFQKRKRQEFMDAGVTLTAPETVFFSYDTKLGVDVTIEPNVVFGPGATVEDAVTVKAFTHIEGATIRHGASVGPYTRLRPAADVGPKSKIGNFVEIKKSTLDEGVKVSHLSYIGDTHIGANANIGAGTITCNYDGFFKYQTRIGAGAFVGSNTALVAPVTVGAGAIIGAGSVITKKVEDDSLALTRADQRGKENYAARFRKRQEEKKQKDKEA
ncbi:bifunctional protein GlmU [Kordiimonas sediminis]|uniref:Bifunctional protein GlmU n=1 Tax=Kordiimonas sediminis TaxID=1735581 RepID=A0A919APG2_9PROT|nr:bifunctional UDP-N-acetylglucosamine diphosphorylase/glucosamine-1-phosphate N-acetyltransferase GlmU [Kordiimonas sediminis]GHF18607.1 bifunctional protein GlmU [Kordiimonas sediminis]